MKRARNAYQFFMSTYKDTVEGKLSERSKQLSEKWKVLPVEEKEKYILMAEDAKRTFKAETNNDQMKTKKIYNSSAFSVYRAEYFTNNKEGSFIERSSAMAKEWNEMDAHRICVHA